MKKEKHEISKTKELLQIIIEKAKDNNPRLKLETLVKIINRIDPNFLKDINEDPAPSIKQLNNRRCVCGIRNCMDTGKDHSEGFENEELYHEVLFGSLGECPDLKASTVRMIFSYVAPQITERMFKRQPCIRKLKYIGPSEDPEEESFFKVGKIYESLDFTGATYSFREYDNGESRIGSCYFEWIE